VRKRGVSGCDGTPRRICREQNVLLLSSNFLLFRGRRLEKFRARLTCFQKQLVERDMLYDFEVLLRLH
jgi:hypothetical protein